jgi:regulator of protease activity HflC (stomatin/prohibitin superfamily)
VCIRQREAGVIERCGAFDSVVGAGPYCLIPVVYTVAAHVSLRIKQLDVRCETKVTTRLTRNPTKPHAAPKKEELTPFVWLGYDLPARHLFRLPLVFASFFFCSSSQTKDNVFVSVVISVQFQVIEEHVKDAWYKLTEPLSQIRAYVEDVIRGAIPARTLVSAFS